MSQKKFAFTGLMFAGKDYVADQAGLKKLSMSRPMTALAEHLTGYSREDSHIPGLRRMWQQLGQWGWGAVSEQYPVTAERSLLTKYVQEHGRSVVPGFEHVDWSQYGKVKSFWIDILLKDIQATPVPASGYAIVNIRFDHELHPARCHGFQLFHVACSEETRQERMAAKGYVQTKTEAADASEMLAHTMAAELPDHQIIWNDHRPMPEGKQYHEVGAWLAHVATQWAT